MENKFITTYGSKQNMDDYQSCDDEELYEVLDRNYMDSCYYYEDEVSADDDTVSMVHNDDQAGGLGLKRQRGISLIDFVIWFAVVGILLSVLYGIFGPSQTQTESQSLLSELQSMQTSIRSVYNAQPSGYSGISDAEVITSHAYPTSLNATATTLNSPYAGAVTISSNDGSGQTFTIEYAGVPSGVCQMIISRLASSGGWIDISVGGSSVWSGTSAMPDKATIDGACAKTSNVDMEFTAN